MDWTETFKILSDDTRLRILNLLLNLELNVDEIVQILDMQQSRISKHLKILKDRNFIQERPHGTYRYYVAHQESFAPSLLQVLEDMYQGPLFLLDKEKIAGILERRKRFAEDFFKSNLSDKIPLGNFYSLENLIIAFSLLISDGAKVLDAGCGQGKLLWYLAHNPNIQLYGIDIYKSVFHKTVLKDADSKLLQRIKLLKADICNTDFQDHFFDIIFTNMVLHHIPQPAQVFLEIQRILKSQGKWIIIDFYEHNKKHMQEKYKDYWSGFRIEQLESYAKKAQLKLKAHYLIPQPSLEGEEMPENIILMFEK